MTARFAKLFSWAVVCALFLVSSDIVLAQNNNNNGGVNVNQRAVGGVQIDPSGVLNNQVQPLDAKIRDDIQRDLQNADGDISKASNLRMISLRGLEAAIIAARDAGKPLPPEVQYMAGLQRIETIVVSPENNDIYIGGPGEGWKLDNAGNVVGVKSGTPVIQLDDFLVAMRSAENARQGAGISVSIDPTEQGVKQYQQFVKVLVDRRIPFNPALQGDAEKAMGPQVITLTGVPKDSRFSQILVAADYKMKRMSMGLEAAPINNFPSVLEMAAKKNVRSMQSSPRFWMECDYEPVAQTDDGLVWQLRGKGVKCLTQESRFDADGKQKNLDKQNIFAVQWAEKMTDRFEELSAAEPAFRELRNIMDMSVVAAIISRNQLLQKAILEIPAINGTTDVIATNAYPVPKSVGTECSFVRMANSWLVSASGGVQLDSWKVAQTTEIVPELASVATTASVRAADRWWWNVSVN